MECLEPNKGHYLPDGTHKFGPSRNGHENEHDLPCGYCDNCRTNKAKLKGFKSFTNSLFTENNCFLTLTYGKYFPITPSGKPTLDKTAVPRFIKRLRKLIHKEQIQNLGSGDLKKGKQIYKTLSKRQKKELHAPAQIGVLYCGEYGSVENTEHPHYHIIIFNYDFDDKTHWRYTKKGNETFRSEKLEKLWPFGFSELGTVTAASCTYVASYIYKKQYGEKAKAHYGDKIPEYVVTPKKNFVTGRQFIRKNIDTIAEQGCFKTIEGHAIGIDTHTLQWIQKEFPEHYLKIKLAKESFNIQKLTKQQKEATQLHITKRKELYAR